MVEQNLTQLEEKLFEKIRNIEKFGIEAQYLPNRVEPGVAYQLDQENRWSKYSGDSLFINQQILSDKLLQESIFWREAFLFFAPKEMREVWWVRVLANCFPLSIKQTNMKYEKWETIWSKVIKSELQNIAYYKKTASSIGPKGIIEALRLGLHQTFILRGEIGRERKTTTKIELNLKEFSLILSKIISESVGLNESAVDIMKIALIKQTTTPRELEKFSDKSKSAISKIVKKLLDMQVLYTRSQVNIHLLNLGTYYMILQCTKKQFETLRKKEVKHPYLFSSIVYYLSSYFILMKFAGPRSKEFYQHLANYGKSLEETNQVFESYVFELTDPYRSYVFKYFDPKTKKQNLNINDIAINYNLMREIPQKQREEEKVHENIKIDIPQFSKAYEQIDTIDLEILNQIFIGNFTRRSIQKSVKKDMNEIVRRLKVFEEQKIITEDVFARLPDSSEIFLFIEGDKNTSKRESVSLVDKMKHLSYHLPNVFFSEINGTFKGILVIVTLPYANIVQFIDFINFFLPSTTTVLKCIGNPIEQRIIRKLPIHRWVDKNWVFYESDFNI